MTPRAARMLVFGLTLWALLAPAQAAAPVRLSFLFSPDAEDERDAFLAAVDRFNAAHDEIQVDAVANRWQGHGIHDTYIRYRMFFHNDVLPFLWASGGGVLAGDDRLVLDSAANRRALAALRELLVGPAPAAVPLDRFRGTWLKAVRGAAPGDPDVVVPPRARPERAPVDLTAKWYAIEGKQVMGDGVAARVRRLGPDGATLSVDRPVRPLDNLRVHVQRPDGPWTEDIYAKVTAVRPDSETDLDAAWLADLAFTAIADEDRTAFAGLPGGESAPAA